MLKLNLKAAPHLKQQPQLNLKQNLNFFEKAVATSLSVIDEQKPLLLAVSGGADSTAMLAALAHLVPKERIHCLHVEHGIRAPEESQGDAAFVVSLCERYELSCRVVNIPQGKIAAFAQKQRIGIEAAARFFRHRLWNREASRVNADHILVAHTQDDLLELVLMRVLRGAGPAGLAALPCASGKILRPLLSLSRHDVIAYLAELQISYCTDSTNADTRYLRNRVRHLLIPLLNEQFPYWKKTLYTLAETQRLIADFLKIEAQNRITWQLDEHSHTLYTASDNFFAQGEIIREESSFHAVNRMKQAERTKSDMPDTLKGRSRSLKRENVRHFASGKVYALDAGPVRMVRKGKRIVIAPVEPVCEEGFSLLIQEPGRYRVAGLSLNCTACRKTEPVFCVDLPVVIRTSGKEGVFCVEDRHGCAAHIVHSPRGLRVKPRQKAVGVFFIAVYQE
ncbi:MAG: tRNA lysidine(34) synthetase TilS [Spirochaetaceae bacterium]|nr:tRNA lysidine(34) synthetase TilS [Spirochaetaceae bacterium]